MSAQFSGAAIDSICTIPFTRWLFHLAQSKSKNRAPIVQHKHDAITEVEPIEARLGVPWIRDDDPAFAFLIDALRDHDERIRGEFAATPSGLEVSPAGAEKTRGAEFSASVSGNVVRITLAKASTHQKEPAARC